MLFLKPEDVRDAREGQQSTEHLGQALARGGPYRASWMPESNRRASAAVTGRLRCIQARPASPNRRRNRSSRPETRRRRPPGVGLSGAIKLKSAKSYLTGLLWPAPVASRFGHDSVAHGQRSETQFSLAFLVANGCYKELIRRGSHLLKTTTRYSLGPHRFRLARLEPEDPANRGVLKNLVCKSQNASVQEKQRAGTKVTVKLGMLGWFEEAGLGLTA